jgi:hypothetical protein
MAFYSPPVATASTKRDVRESLSPKSPCGVVFNNEKSTVEKC